MNARSSMTGTDALKVLAVTAIAAVAWPASADEIEFPRNFDQGVQYGTVTRGNIREELYTSRAAIEAARKGEHFPDGTVITLVDYRDGQLFRYVVMEKRKGSGAGFPADLRNGDWRYQEFTPERIVNRNEDGTRCMRCHKGQESRDFVFTTEQMRRSK